MGTERKYLTVIEAEGLKRNLEKDVITLLREFEAKTGMSIKDIDLERAVTPMDTTSIIAINIDVKLNG